MRTTPIVVALFAANLALAAAQSVEKPPVDITYPTQAKLITPREVIHAKDEPEPPDASLTPIQRAMQVRERIYNNMVAVEFEVVINQNGRVESAHAIDGPKAFYEQAEAIEMRRAFEPIRVDGAVVRARFHDGVEVLPPERWADHATPFPADPDLRTLSITLERTRCFGSCPSYTVTVEGTGLVTFRSQQGLSVAIPGTHVAHITPEAVRDLLGRFRTANFLSALDTYECGWTDLPAYTLTLSINGVQKKVVDYGGSIVGLPDAVENLESAVDEVTGTDRWIHGNADTLTSLQNEHWNFAAPSSENLALYNSVIRGNDRDLLPLFLSAKAPIVSADPHVLSPACTASGVGNRELVQRMLGAQPPSAKFSTDLLTECLSMAAASGNLAVVDLWLDRGARPIILPKPSDGTWRQFRPALIGAIQSANPEVLARLLHFHPDLSPAANEDRSVITFVLEDTRTNDVEIRKRMVTLLLEAGANINEVGKNDQAPPIFYVTFVPDLVSTLVAGGANINARAANGDTPLMRNCFVKEAVQSLLAAGANPMLKDPQGKTALDRVQTYSCPECAAELTAAMKAHTDAATPSPTPVVNP